MNKKVNIITLSRIMSLLLLLSITGCMRIAYNLKTTDDLGGKKVLAGRILYYDNDTPLDRKWRNRFHVFFHKEGDKKVQMLVPDEDGFVYVPVTTGRYKFASVRVIQPMIAAFTFNLRRFPSVTVNDNDSAVNFGTFNVKYYLTGAEKAAAFFGVGGAHLEVEHVPNYDVTRAGISTLIGNAIPLTDGKVTFVDRDQNDPRAPI